MNRALFGAGCFWGIQYYFDEVPGVIKTTVGYSGGDKENPTYDEVCTHTTGHAEVTLIEFDDKKVSYETLVKHFFRIHDPTQLNRQGSDVGNNYRSVIFYFDDEQKAKSEKAIKEAQKNYKEHVVTELSPAGKFYEAEPYHQGFSKRTGIGQCHVSYAPVN